LFLDSCFQEGIKNRIEIDIMFDSKCLDLIHIPNASKCMLVNYGILALDIDGEPEVN
jgi:hypothetical protein